MTSNQIKNIFNTTPAQSEHDIINNILNDQTITEPESEPQNKENYERIKIGLTGLGEIAYILNTNQTPREQIISNPRLARNMTIKELKEISHNGEIATTNNTHKITIPAAPYIAILRVGGDGQNRQIITSQTLTGLIAQVPNTIINTDPLFQQLPLRAIIETQNIIKTNMTQQQEKHEPSASSSNWYNDYNLSVTTILTSALQPENKTTLNK